MESTHELLEKCILGNANELEQHRDRDSKSKTFHISHKLEGVVLYTTSSKIFSKVFDVTTEEFYEFAFDYDLVSEDDHEFIEEGALFNFYSGSLIKNKTNTNSELIKFRRRLKSKNEFDEILDFINEIDFDNLIERY